MTRLCIFLLALPWIASAQNEVPAHELATKLVAACDEASRAELLKDYADPSRTDWHYIPKADRKGLDLRKATAAQTEATFALLADSLSKNGHKTVREIMNLEALLAMLENNKERRDPKKYFITLFGTPGPTGQWSYSFEGHHLSLNFAYEDGKLACATPFFLAANPDRVVKSGKGLPPVGTRVLQAEKDLAVALLQSLDPDLAILGTPDRDMKEGGKTQAHERRRIGVAGKDMNGAQRKHLEALVDHYLSHLPTQTAADIKATMKTDALHFAWHGTADPAKPYRYQVVGPTHVILYYNTQGDSLKTPTNHSHAILRSIGKDFNIEE